MRILYVTQVRLDCPYGGARHVQAIVKAWSAMGHKVYLVAAGKMSELPGVTQFQPPSWIQPGTRMEVVLASLAAYVCARYQPEIGYIRLSASTSVVPFTLRRLGLPLVFELNGCLLDELRQRGRKEWQIQAVQHVQKQVLRHGLLVAVDACTERHGREHLGALRTRVVENGADTEIATPGSRIEARRRLGLPLEGVLIGFAGTLASELRFDLLEAALSHISPKPVLVVAGDGHQRSFFTSRSDQDSMIWLGAISHERAIDVLRASDICANVRDGIVGMKTLEYASVGRRFVTFDVEGVERLLSLYPRHQVVFLVKERTETAMAEALTEALAAERAGPLPLQSIEYAQGLVSWLHTAR